MTIYLSKCGIEREGSFMPRPKLPEHKKKVYLPVTVDPDVAKEAKASGNASEWVNEMCKIAMKLKKTKK